MGMRIGYGWDSHAFRPGVPLKLGGIAVDHPRGLHGHSDGDVLLHAITDALLGAIAAGDIGSFFPPDEPRWKGADSTIFLAAAVEEVATAGYRIVNLDTTMVLAAPKIGPIANQMRERIADLLMVRPNAVGIKAKTPEGLAQDDVAVAHAIVLLEEIEEEDTFEAAEEAIQIPEEAEESRAEAVGKSSTGRKRMLPSFDIDDIT